MSSVREVSLLRSTLRAGAAVQTTEPGEKWTLIGEARCAPKSARLRGEKLHISTARLRSDDGAAATPSMRSGGACSASAMRSEWTS